MTDGWAAKTRTSVDPTGLPAHSCPTAQCRTHSPDFSHLHAGEAFNPPNAAGVHPTISSLLALSFSLLAVIAQYGGNGSSYSQDPHLTLNY